MSIVQIICMVIAVACTLFMLISTIYTRHKISKLWKEFADIFEEEVKNENQRRDKKYFW